MKTAESALILMSALCVVAQRVPWNQQTYQQMPTYQQYSPGNQGYIPYPYANLQSPVSTQGQNYQPFYNYLPTQGIAYPASQPYSGSLPYLSQPYYNYGSGGNYQNTFPNTVKSDPYANIKDDIIDVDPQSFANLMRHLKFQPNIYPESSGGNVQQSQRRTNRPVYVVNVDRKHSNSSNVPQGINKHEIQSKTYSFKRTFTINPKESGNSVINLNFVNGVQVTTSNPREEEEDEVRASPTENTKMEEMVQTTTEGTVETTTENDTPTTGRTTHAPSLTTKSGRRFIDVPSNCPDGTSSSFSGSCLSPFQLKLNITEGTTASTRKPRQKIGRKYINVPRSCPAGTVMSQSGECTEPF